MINNIIGSDKAAIYSVAYTFSMMFTILTNAINSSFIPYTYKSLKKQNYKELKKNASILVLLVGVACIIAMGLGAEFIRIFAAPKYYEARWVVIPVAESLLFLFIYPLFCNVEFYFEKTKFIMVASSGAAIINILLNYLFIPKFGYIAAAYTTLVCYILLTIAHYVAYKKLLKQFEIRVELYNIRLILIVVVISLIFMTIMIMIYDLIILRLTVISVIVLIMGIKIKKIILKILQIRSEE